MKSETFTAMKHRHGADLLPAIGIEPLLGREQRGVVSIFHVNVVILLLQICFYVSL